MSVQVFHIRDGVPLPQTISQRARLIVWPGVGATVASMNYVVLEPGESNAPHAHEQSEDTIFILEGTGTVRDYGNDTVLPVEAGCIIHVPPGITHAVAADTRMVSVGGPCPPDLAMLRAAEVL